MFIQAYDLFLEQVRGLIVDRDGSHDWHKEGDELVNDDVEEAADKATVKKMPSVLKATVQFGYDAALARTLDTIQISFDSYVSWVFTHVQAYFRHPSLGTQIEFEVLK